MADPVAAARAMVVLHATEPSTVHLSVAARTDGTSPTDVERELTIERTLVKQLAMRRTLFAMPRDLLGHAWGSASARVAINEGKKLAKDLRTAGITDDPEAWLRDAEAMILRAIGREGTAAQAIREACPDIDVRIDTAPASSWSSASSIVPRILTWMGARGRIVRGTNTGHWRTSRPLWTRVDDWLTPVPDASTADAGYAELLRRWLRTFGPGTETDIAWWLGATKTAVRRALRDVDAVPVALDRDGIGWVLPDDLDEEPEVAPWVALLPTLDPTTMGWKERDFYLAPDLAPLMFDTRGNGGTTAWVDGRVVGSWVHDADGRVRIALATDVSAAARRALDREAERLTDWLDGVVISNVYKSPQMTLTTSYSD